MKRPYTLLFTAFMLLLSCQDEVDAVGNVEIIVKKTTEVNGVPYDEIQIGIFPTESLITKDFSGYSDIIQSKKLENGKALFKNLLPDTYVAAVITSAYPQPGTRKLVQIIPGKTIKIDLIE
jgi:hypothetical protein